MADRIVMTDEGIARRFGLMGRKSESVRWDDLQEVRIHTTADGPSGEDVFFVLMGSAGGCVVPQGQAPGGFVERLQALPEFDNGAMIEAMGATTESDFLCWRV